MNQYTVYKISLVFLFLTLPASTCFANELRTRYATIIYEQEDYLSQFNKRISIQSFSDLKESTKNITESDEVIYKLDAIIEKIEKLLHVYIMDLKFNIILLPTATEVKKYYKIEYGGIAFDYVAFYCPHNKTVYISLNDINEYVLAHELTHVLIAQYFKDSASAIIQEILAHFVETHIGFWSAIICFQFRPDRFCLGDQIFGRSASDWKRI